MCGLFGITYGDAREVDLARVRRALHSLTHRGPDQWGEIDHDGVYLGHRRLSIVDTSEAGRQPMVSADGRFAITVNGEIYNHVALRRELAHHPFRSDSDSEVVLHGVREWGVHGLVDRLDGMFAAVIHDRGEGAVHLLRDRVGIKPLYYFFDGRRLVWASELKAIRVALGEASLSIDHSAVFDALTYRYIPAPKSLYVGVSKVRPAEVVSFDVRRRSLSTRRYWFPDVGATDSAADPHAELRERVDAAVESHLMSDVPLGFFLSGGIDSAVVLGHAARHHPDPVAYTIGYDDPARDETDGAVVAAQHFGARHVVRRLEASDSIDLPGRMARWFDEPFADSSALSTFEVCQLARTGSTVALSGDGGDELFGGYRWYRRAQRLAPLQRRLSPLSARIGPTRFADHLPTERGRRLGRNLDRVMRTDVVGLYAHLMGDHVGGRKERWRRALDIASDYDPFWAFREHDRSDLPLLTRLQWIDFNTFLPDGVLTKVDRVSMAVSLEVRVPLLARDVVEFAFRQSPSFHGNGERLKAGFKDAYSDLLPPGAARRPKQGFSVPISAWQNDALGAHETLVEAVLAQFVEL